MFPFDTLVTSKSKVAERENSGTAQEHLSCAYWGCRIFLFPVDQLPASFSKTGLVTSSAR